MYENIKIGNVSTVPVQTVVSLSMLAEFRLGWSTVDEWLGRLHCKKGYKYSHSQPGCLQTIPDREQLNYSSPGRVWLVTSRLRTGKSLTFFYSVDTGTLR